MHENNFRTAPLKRSMSTWSWEATNYVPEEHELLLAENETLKERIERLESLSNCNGTSFQNLELIGEYEKKIRELIAAQSQKDQEIRSLRQSVEELRTQNERWKNYVLVIKSGQTDKKRQSNRFHNVAAPKKRHVHECHDNCDCKY